MAIKPTTAPAPTRKPADYGIVPPAVKLARERAAAMAADKAAQQAELNKQKQQAQRNAQEQTAELERQRQQAQRNAQQQTAAKPVLGGIRAANDVTNPEVMKQQTAMAASGKTNTGYEPPGSQYSSLAGANKPGMAPVTPPSGPQILTARQTPQGMAIKKGGMIKKKKSTGKAYISGGKVSSASKRGDGCAQRGKTKGRMV